MNILTDNYEAVEKMFNYLKSISPIILAVIIIIQLGLLTVGYFYHNRVVSDRDNTNNQIAMEIFNIKQATKNLAALTLYPKSILSNLPNFQSKYECQFVINPYLSFGNHFAIKISSKSKIQIELLDGQIFPSQFIGGFYSIHLNNDSFNSSPIDYYSIDFLLYVETSPVDIKVDIINENVDGIFKFHLPN
mgnify:CR=1 FL=1